MRAEDDLLHQVEPEQRAPQRDVRVGGRRRELVDPHDHRVVAEHPVQGVAVGMQEREPLRSAAAVRLAVGQQLVPQRLRADQTRRACRSRQRS